MFGLTSCSPSEELVRVGIGPTRPPADSVCVCTTNPPTTSTVVSGSTTPPQTISTNPPSSSTPVSPADSLTLTPPRFIPDGGTWLAGTRIRIVTDSLPPNAILEYSTDDGQSWKTATSFQLADGGPLLARIRVGARVTRTRVTNFSVFYERALIIGNSIMEHAPLPALGWFNTNGMAASAPDKDFVHIISQRLRALHPNTAVRLQQGGEFEREFWKFDVNKMNDGLSSRPDLIIVRIAENVDPSAIDTRNFEKYYRALLEHIAAKAAPFHKIVCSTSFWNQPATDAVIRKVAHEKGYAVAELCNLVDKREYMALDYKDIGVAQHPNDLGMLEISKILWLAIQ